MKELNPSEVFSFPYEILANIASEFLPFEKVSSIHQFPSGNINNTFLVCGICHDRESSLVIQEINSDVFPEPDLILSNWILAVEFIEERRHCLPELVRNKRWEVPKVIASIRSKKLIISFANKFWRAIQYIDNSYNCETISSNKKAEEIGLALSRFHFLIKELPIVSLAKTSFISLDISTRLSELDNVVQYKKCASTPSHLIDKLDFCFALVSRLRKSSNTLEKALKHNQISLRPIHGDTKVSNFLFDSRTDEAIALIDFETIQPGLYQFDIGDCIRSCCNPAGEEPKDLSLIEFNLSFLESFMAGYFSFASSYLTPTDINFIPHGIKWVPFQLGTRFLTDYLHGDRYFSSDYQCQNLIRAYVQFSIVVLVESNFQAICNIVNQKYYSSFDNQT